MFKTRLLSGIVLVIIALITVIGGGDILFATLLIISLIGMSELYKILHVNKKLLGIVGYAAAAVYYFLIRFQKQDMVMMAAIAFCRTGLLRYGLYLSAPGDVIPVLTAWEC